MNNGQNTNPNVKTIVTKKVVTTTVPQAQPTVVVKPVPINSTDAINIAREQEEQLRRMREQQAAMEAQAMSGMQNVDAQPMNQMGTVIPNGTETQQKFDNSVAQFNEVNDLVQVVEEKNNKLLIAIMALILTVIVVIIIAQLPMLFNL